MTFLRTILIVLSLSICACASQEGVYEPACIAYEGDRLELKGGRFEWQRFTDERMVGDDGDVVPPFPGYPKYGTYQITNGRLELRTDDNVELEDWIIVDQVGQRYMLDAKQHNVFLESGTMPECALRLSAAE
ncbi:MAG: hypothetical protein ACR2QZ_00965 [Woeseiaceae bacterium]